MGARVDLHLRLPSGKTLATAALLNGGFEAETPHVLLPERAYLHLDSARPTGTQVGDVQTAGGASEVLILPEPIDAWVHGGDRVGPTVSVSLLVSSAETEVLVSDTAIDALAIEITSHGKGVWRFSGEVPGRPSVPPQLW